MPDDADHRQQATAYLADVLGDAAPATLELVSEQPGGELTGEGAVSIYRFMLAPGGEDEQPFFVVAGQTEPNYYPAWDLDADQMYSVHLGTRFMLVLEISQVPLEALPASLEAQVRELLASVAPDASVREIEPVAAFAAEGAVHAVCRVTVADEEVYVVTADAPPGIYRQTHLPPHVVYRLHLGKLIRAEREEPADAADP